MMQILAVATLGSGRMDAENEGRKEKRRERERERERERKRKRERERERFNGSLERIRRNKWQT